MSSPKVSKGAKCARRGAAVEVAEATSVVATTQSAGQLGHNTGMPSNASPAAAARLDAWFSSPDVKRVMGREQAELIPALTAQIGVRGLYLRPAGSVPRELSGNMLQTITTLHRVDGGWCGDLRCADAELPIGNECFSVAYLLHALEQVADPGLLVQECVRCLQPEGLLLLVVFNPYSPFRRHWPSSAFSALGRGRVEQMLDAAGLHIERRAALAGLGAATVSEPPLQRLLRRAGAPFAPSFAFVARKRRAAPTLVGPAAGRLRARATPW